jgi:hypothetical protein
VAVYRGPFEAVTLDGERVVAQSGGFLRRMDRWGCCRAVQGRTWLLGLVRAGVRRVRHHGGLLPLLICARRWREPRRTSNRAVITGEGDRHWSAACATFWHATGPINCGSSGRVRSQVAIPTRPWGGAIAVHRRCSLAAILNAVEIRRTAYVCAARVCRV